MGEYIIETKNLSKKFGGFYAVNDVNLQVPKGNIYGFLGPNGAGKSTTIRMLLGLIKPTNGSVTLFGKSMKDSRIDILKNVGSMVEYPSYYGHLTAYENLEIIRKILEIDKKEIDKVLKIVNLTNVQDKLVKKFSLGMKQRLGIAQALLGNPALLILDEPTNGLDPAGIHEIRDLVKSLPSKMGITVLVSSHILSEIELIADRVGIINKGNLIFQGTLDELREKSELEILVDARPKGDAGKYLSNKGFLVGEKEGMFIIKDMMANPADINRDLILSGHEVYHISQRRDTLEDIFLQMTKEENRT
ncbi:MULTISPECIES: ABC transporter ATP-binding protein [unclassified Bacillus (in: firmicutes)]|uniref:ABC transporter ATP-binding protein n=1 Tax=unclassified Bacillus (in: firmicutes) TaxID=185979 RepID=UPI0008E417FE|nr:MULTISPECIES: ABC transporter ATP-binding protein [unclassified Bacillus (in: firmicutes)]SFI69807.1 ABC-2 type transport system ATP-binding protein [Bacillus sp. 71mf]SFS89754.1 ABC-2 type transport system ATP-binding protein [Bacillus sp. 103mf]